jgi:serine phosphatase RsbU (regulator of sigma subunit)
MTSHDTLPLHRLLNREAVEGLLAEFEALLPGVELALIRVDGRVFAGKGEWPRTRLAEALARNGDGQGETVADCQVQPLRIESQPVGALVARGPAAERALRSLHRSLTMILTQSLEKREIVRETLERYREINLLYQIGETIGACLDLDDIPRLELTETSRVIQVDASVVLLPASEGADELEVKASLGAGELVDALRAAARPVIDQVRLSGRPDIVTPSPGGSALIGAILCAPLKAQERVRGVALLGRVRGRPVFTAGEEKLALALASQAAIAVERAWLHQQEVKRQRMEEELAIGRRIQLSLLPESCPQIPGWEFAATYQAARQVGGDFYDFFELPDDPRRLGMVIADVTGKGVPAALMMAASRVMIRAESMSGRNPAAVLERANRQIFQDNRTQLLLSTFYATLDVHTGRLAFASGGHNGPLWYRTATRECQELMVRGLILGFFPDIALEEREIDVSPGDVLVFYTDGVTEAMNAERQMFGDERLQTIVTSHAEAGAAQVVRAIVAAIRDFVGDVSPSDDITLFAVKRLNPSS